MQIGKESNREEKKRKKFERDYFIVYKVLAAYILKRCRRSFWGASRLANCLLKPIFTIFFTFKGKDLHMTYFYCDPAPINFSRLIPEK